jgi:hypothetical protein
MAQLYPQALGSIFIASYDSVEVFDPASTRDTVDLLYTEFAYRIFKKK